MCHRTVTVIQKMTRPIIPNVGMLASFDPVALDLACADLCNQQPVLSNSVLAENVEQHKHEHGDCNCEHGHDHFYYNHPDTNWRQRASSMQ